jgi:hypothetical protein
MGNVAKLVDQLGKERTRLANELQGVTAALTAFSKVYLKGKSKAVVTTRKKRTISAASRKKMALAQRARWAKVKAKKKTA